MNLLTFQQPVKPLTTPKPEPITAEYNFKLLGLFGYEEFSFGTPIIGCSTKVTNCPPGHEMLGCRDTDNKEAFLCKQCGLTTFQPNINREGDKCRLRKVCHKPFMEYKHIGSTIKDAQCQCIRGFHFENRDQRACVPNRECGQGYGQGEYGTCIQCIKYNMYSGTSDRFEKCKAVTDCHKLGRCIMKKSNGVYDNTCGIPVEDLSKCSELSPAYDDGAQGNISQGVVVGCVLGALSVFVIILFVALYFRRRLSRMSSEESSLSKQQLEDILHNLITKSEKDEVFCKKVLTTYVTEIETRIDRQAWSLAQELFRNHYQAAKYEILVEKYKETQLKMAINGYLSEWREWRGETAEALSELLRCLKMCGREDITYGISSKFQEELTAAEFTIEDGQMSKNTQYRKHFLQTLLPCLKKKSKTKRPKSNKESKETANKLLETEFCHKVENKVYQDRPIPSAPIFCDRGESGLSLEIEYKGTMSYPIQASS